MKVWDGSRPRSPRTILTRRELEMGPIGIVSATEDLTNPTDWCFEEKHHTVVVHLGGQLRRMECEFSVGPSGNAIPATGDVWIIPAGCRYAALAQGDNASFIELRVPTSIVGRATMQPRVQWRDDFLAGAAARLRTLIDQPDDDLAAMTARAIVDALHLHVAEQYGRSGPFDVDQSLLSGDDRRRLVDAIRGGLDHRHSLEALAALVGREVRPFTTAFREAFGLTPWQFVLRARLEEAARMLREETRSVTEIALEVGFSTPSHFASSFSRQFGTTPTHYRAIHRS